MTESQNIEYKPNWRDEYLKWICGFANANGGKLLIGVDDKGHVIGVDDQKRLMEEYAGGIQITFLKNEKVGEKVGKEVGEKVGENLSNNQVKIMHCMLENKHIAIVDMAKIVGIAEKNIEKNIKELKKMGIVKRVGPAKGGYWEVTEKGK